MNCRLALACMALALSILSNGGQSLAGGTGIEAAAARAKKAGMPMFVVAVTATCPHCVLLHKRLASEADLKPLLSRYVCFEMLVNSPDWLAWTQTYRPGSPGVPLIFIIDAQGKEIYNRGGAPQGDGLKMLLQQGLLQAGAPKPKAKAEEKPLFADRPKSATPEKKKYVAVAKSKPAKKPAPAVSAPREDKGHETAASRPSDDLKKVASYLRLAKTFAATRPEKSKEYARKIIDLLPESDEAAEARALLSD